MRCPYTLSALFYFLACQPSNGTTHIQSARPIFNRSQTHKKTPTNQGYVCAIPIAMQVWFRPNMPVNHALFSPCDKIKETILTCINHERRRISIAVFWLTDIDIAHALIAARIRGVIIEVVTDPSCLEYQYNKIGILIEHGIIVYIYKKKRKVGTSGDKMHEKFALFEQTLYGKRILIEGSYNYTQSANKLNCEHVVIHDNREIVNQFGREFERLKKVSIVYKKKLTAMAYA